MRFVVAVAILSFVAVIAPTPTYANVVFRGFYCPPRLPCDESDPAFPPVQTIIATVNGCVSGNLSVKSDDSLFDQTAGLDSSGCLSTNPSAFATRDIIPHCCVESVPEGNCSIHCSLLVGQ